MKTFSKVLAAVLLLALLTSVLGIFSAFAEENTVAEEVTYGTTIIGPSAITNIKGQSGGQPSMSQKTDANGSTYYTLAFDGVDPVSGDYIEIGGASTGDTAIRVGNRTETVDNGDGTTTTQVMEGYEKNTDYMVVDFDMSTDTTYIDGLYFHTAFYDADYNHAGRYQPKAMYFDLDGEDNESFSVGLNGEANVNVTYAYAPYAEDVWQHVTFVYDFRDTSNVSVHFYINGIYSGSATSINISTALTFYFLRLSTPAQSINNASTNFANFSIKRFDVGYDGPFTGDRALANRGVTLDQLPDLAYCLENTPETEKTKLAYVERADGSSFTAYDVSDLDANLMDGDVVTLYKGISRSLLVPEGATITFKDSANTTITPGTYTEGDLVNMSALTTLDFTANTVVERSRKSYAVSSSGTDLADTMSNESSCVYTLLADSTATLVNEGSLTYYSVLDLNGHTATLSTTSEKHAFGAVNYKFVDGTIVWNGGGADFSMTNSPSVMMIFDEVNLVHNSGTFIDGRGGIVMFNDCNVTRNPYLYSTSKKQYSTGTLVSQKSRTSIAMTVIVDGTTIDFTNVTAPEGYTMYSCGNMFLMNNISTSGVRYSGALNYLTIRDGSDLKIAGSSLIYAHAYTSTEGTAECEQVYVEGEKNPYQNKLVSFTPSENGSKNINTNYLDIIDSTITGTHSVLSTDISFSTNRSTPKVSNVTVTDPTSGEEITVTYVATSYTVYATQFDYDVDVDIKSSTIQTGGSSVVYVDRPATIRDDLVANYDYDVNVDIDGDTKFVDAGIVVNRTYAVDAVIDIADGARMNTDNVLSSADDGAQATVTLGSGTSVIALTGLDTEGYDCVVTPTYRDGSYVINNYDNTETKSGTFIWNGTHETDPILMDKIVTLPESTTVYKYTDFASEDNANFTSRIVPNFTVSANLTALSDFYLNVYLSAGVDTSALNMTVGTLNATEFVEVVGANGTKYLKAENAVVKGITPERVSEDFPVTISFVGGYEETVSLATNLSLEQYLLRAYNATGSDAGNTFIQAIINYVVAATKYDGGTAPTALDELDTTVTAPTYTDAKWEALSGVSAGLNLGDSVRWVFTAKAGDTYTFEYAGSVRTFKADENGKIIIGVKAVDLLGDIKITNADGATATVNLAGYYDALSADADAQAVVNALYYYSQAASAYAAEQQITE